MTGYGQFCATARAHEVLGGRWTLLVVRELLGGSRRFNDIRRGIPRISRTMLSERLQDLAFAGVVTRLDGAQGPEYELTEAGKELSGLVGKLADCVVLSRDILTIKPEEILETKEVYTMLGGKIVYQAQ